MKTPKQVTVDLVALALQNAHILEEPEEKIDHFLRPENLQSLSDVTLQQLMLTRLNHAANIRKQISDSIELLATQIAEARVAEMLLRSRDKAKRSKGAVGDPEAEGKQEFRRKQAANKEEV